MDNLDSNHKKDVYHDLFFKVIENVVYKNFSFEVRYAFTEKFKPRLLLFRVIFMAPDTYTGKIEPQKCREWAIYAEMSEFEIVDTIFKAIRQAEEHEVRESFFYKGQRLFNPHKNLIKKELRIEASKGVIK